MIFVVEDDAQNGGDHVDAHRSIALVAGPFVKKGEVVSKHYTTVSMIRTIVDVLGIESPGLNDATGRADGRDLRPFGRSRGPTPPKCPAVLYTTQLPLPAQTAATQPGQAPSAVAAARPLRSADYWEQAMAGQNFEREDDLSTDAFNLALWIGLRGEDVPYPLVRHGKDLRRDRRRLLAEYTSGLSNR